MVHELERSRFAQVLPLFEGSLQDPIIHAVTEGTLGGRVGVDDPDCPAAALVWTGTGYGYLAGGEENGEFSQALRQLVVERVMAMVQTSPPSSTLSRTSTSTGCCSISSQMPL